MGFWKKIFSPRLSASFSPNQAKELNRMAEDLDTDMEGVIRKALSLLSVCIKETKSGNKVAVVDGGFIIKSIPIHEDEHGAIN